MIKLNMTKLFFDTETTGLPPKGARYDKDYDKFPHIVQLAWKKVEPIPEKLGFTVNTKSLIIKPDGYIIPDKAIKIHGITNDIANITGVPISYALQLFLSDCATSERLIAHNIYFDTSIIKANSLKCRLVNILPLSIWDEWGNYSNYIQELLHKSKRICTMMSTIKFCNLKQNGSNRIKFPSLQELHKKLFGSEFEGAHNAKYDVLALEKCYNELIRRKIIK